LRLAQLLAVQRALESTWDPTEMQNLEIQRQALAAAVERDRDEGWNNLDGMRLPSIFALLLAGDLRAEDRGEDAVVLCETLLEDLGNGGSLEQGAWGAWLAARVQIALGGSLSDAGRPRQAMAVLEEAVLGLEAVENTLEERKQGERDERILAIHDAQLKQTRGLRAEALVALAVTSNVRLGNPESALAYFERAYALQQTDFMKGLLACYRARFGAEDEARALLRTIEPAPAVYYNLACAHALLGDVDEALGMLHRELEENHFSPGSLARQKRGAEGDPDLASLWEDPRFLSLVSE
jgi:tetratricopeptide (TPR) repeat protein